MAFSSSSYMRKRLPQPKARIETFALVRPSVRLGSEAIVGWAFTMGTSPARENDCSAEPRKRRGSPGAVRQCGRGTAAQVRHAAGESDSISDGFPQDPVSLAPLRIHARTGSSGLFAPFCPLAFLLSPGQSEGWLVGAVGIEPTSQAWECCDATHCFSFVGFW